MADDLEAIARKLRRSNAEFHQVAREAYEFTRQYHADPKYEAFRDSEQGRAWKTQKLVEYNYRCPECNRIINERNSSIDHKHPRRYYPWLAWDINNLWLMCKGCNKSKSDKKWDQYLSEVKIRRGQAAVDHILKFAPPATPD